MSNPKIITTDDGSHSLYLPEMNETYHSSHGAVRESRHVFIKHGIEAFAEQFNIRKIRVLEVGFGTGLNALLVLAFAKEREIPVFYETIESQPLQEEVIKQINYGQYYTEESYQQLHFVPWEVACRFGDYFTLTKRQTTLQEYSTDEVFDVVLFDAFAPSKQPEMWRLEMIRKTTDLLKAPGIWVTYSARGQLKRDLSALHLNVETLPGPPGKKEMVRALKHPNSGFATG